MCNYLNSFNFIINLFRNYYRENSSLFGALKAKNNNNNENKNTFTKFYLTYLKLHNKFNLNYLSAAF